MIERYSISFYYCFYCNRIATAGTLLYKQYFMPNEAMVNPYDSADTILVIEGEEILEENPPKVIEGQILLPFDTVKAHIDPYIWWDEKLQKVTVTTADRVIRMETDNLNALINSEPMELKFPASEINGELYIP